MSDEPKYIQELRDTLKEKGVSLENDSIATIERALDCDWWGQTIVIDGKRKNVRYRVDANTHEYTLDKIPENLTEDVVKDAIEETNKLRFHYGRIFSRGYEVHYFIDTRTGKSGAKLVDKWGNPVK